MKLRMIQTKTIIRMTQMKMMWLQKVKSQRPIELNSVKPLRPKDIISLRATFKALRWFNLELEVRT